MTATVHNIAQARKAKIIRDAKLALQRGLVYIDPMAAWYSPSLLLVLQPYPASIQFSQVGDPNSWDAPTQLPCDTEPA
jgi:hypothetical protein